MADKTLEQVQEDAVKELQTLQTEKGWTDDQVKEFKDKINAMASEKDIEDFLEAHRKDEKKGQDENNKEKNSKDEKKELTPEERKAAREEQVPTDEFIEFIEKGYGEGSFEKHYEKGPDEEKDRFEIQYEAVTKKSPLREAKATKINEMEIVKDTEGKENTNTDHSEEPSWKKMRREAWEKYATDNKQEFKLLSEDKAPDLSMTVGDTPIQYADEHNVTMGNGEYEKFLKAVEIEKQAKTDVINFGTIESEEFKIKLAVACIQQGMRMKNAPKSLDLSLECFKNLDDATRAKVEAYNQKQAQETSKAETKEATTKEKPEIKAETKEATTKEKPETKAEAKEATNKYQKLFEEKLTEYSAKKEKGEALDFSQIKDPVERVVAYAAAKEAKLTIENLSNYEKLIDRKLDDKSKAEVAEARASLSENSQKHLKARETWEQKLGEVKARLKNKEQRRGQYRDKDGKIVDSRMTLHDKDGKVIQDVARNDIEYEIKTQDDGQKKKTYKKDDKGLYILKERGGRS